MAVLQAVSLQKPPNGGFGSETAVTPAVSEVKRTDI
jgi:hypothetical protein